MFGVRISRQHDGLLEGAEGPDAPVGLNAIHSAFHEEVQEDKVGAIALEIGDGFFAGIHADHLVSKFCQEHLQGFP